MADRGRELGADLYQLQLMATLDLPAVAEQYDLASLGLLDAVADPQLFGRPAVFGGDRGTLFEPWAGLCEDIRGCLAESARGLRDTASALLIAVQTYAGADHAARDELDRLRAAGELGSTSGAGAAA